ncbi:DUF1758 domain-containing protein [Caerostris extrusa]|uniref:DUF1758 domain-containing protein n=1 Tax=Caerostris extrusa TaxID=172846 RepID=A0AAV4MVT3_CAEEX|nr:DUF1758 domain-containing protein [Caerostris extrusa]
MENSLEYSEQIIKYKSRVNRYLSESVQVGKDEINKVPVVTTEIKKESLIAISGLPLTADNYKKAIDILTDRFGKTDILISTHMNVLLSLEPVRNSSDVSTLRKLYDKITIQIRCLESLKVGINSYASERSYICESIAERAGLKTVGKEKLKIFTFASNEASVSELKRKRITLKNCNSDLVITLEALATKTICASKISSPSSRMVELLKNEGFELSDSGASSGRVDILIGNDYLSAVLTGRTHRLNNCLMLYESVFGWTLSGRDEFNERTVGKESAGLFIQVVTKVRRIYRKGFELCGRLKV